MARAIKAILLAGACGLAAGCAADGSTDDTAGDEEIAPVAIEIVEASVYEPELRLSTVFRGVRDVILAAKSAGEIVARPADLGDAVAAGDPLLLVDDRAARANLGQAEAAVAGAAAAEAQAARDLERKQRLVGLNHASDAEIEAARLRFDAAAAEHRAALSRAELARVALADTRVAAPFAGVIAACMAETGASVAPGAPLFRLVAVDSLEAAVGVVDHDLAGLAVGRRATAAVAALGGAVVEGRIARIGPQTDPVTGTYPLEIVFPDPDHRLRPGMAAEIGLVRALDEERILVPEAAVSEQFGRQVLFRVERGRARRIEPVLGGRVDGRRVVLSGLAPGDSLVVGGLEGLGDGRRVRVVPADGAP